jgi:hypothetical protein
MGYGVYIFFASMLVLASAYAWFFIHETKGVRMDQMDELFGYERPAVNYTPKVIEEGHLDDRDGKQNDAQVSRIEMA